MSHEQVLHKLDRHLRAMAADPERQEEIVPIILRLGLRAEGDTPAEKARNFEARVQPLGERLRALGAESVALLWLANSIAARLPVSALCSAAAEPDVDAVISDHPRKAL